MKIDRARMRKTTSEVPLECRQLIEHLQACSQAELLEELSKINTWTFGKCELFHWAPVLDIFDSILEEAADSEEDNKWALYCDIHYTNTEKNLLLWILHFSTLLIEHSFSRHLYNSMEHLLVLLQSNDMAVVLGVLNLFYMFSKRSNFITRLKAEEKSILTSRLLNLAENWGGKENGFGLADCCNAEKTVAPSATTLHVEFHKEDPENKDKKDGKCVPNIIHIEHVDKLHKTPAEIMKSLIGLYYVPPGKEMWLFTHVRLAHHFADYRSRLLCVQARLQALSVLVYSNSIQDSPHNLLYNGILDELVELVELSHLHLVEIRSAALRTLTAIIHLDRSPHIAKKPGSRLHNIIDVTGASQYHGFLPVLVRSCIAILTNQNNDSSSPIKTVRNVENISSEHNSESSQKPGSFESSEEKFNALKVDEYVADVVSQMTNDRTQFPLPLATALFSFLYHLASYEAGGDALVSCGMMESLLQVINWHGVELEHITFVTRAVRVIDLITNIDMQAFQTHGGLLSFINRLNVEVKLCQKDQLYELKVAIVDAIEEANPGPSETNTSTNDGDPLSVELEHIPENVGKTCLPQRAALLKSMLNFLKKALQDNTFSDNIRHLMEGTLPNSLKNIIANAEYYGPSLFLLATDVVTVYVYQEPSLLSALQDNGLTDVVLHALLVKEVPSTREVLGSLPNVFSALCLNNRGLQSFVKCKPFEKFFKVLLMPSYLPAMRRRRSSEPMADTACNLGNAMDELMRHQPSLKSDATKAIVNLLQELVHLGTDPKYVCWRPHSKTEVSPSITSRNSSNAEGSSDEEDDEEEEASTSSQNGQTEAQIQGNSERKPIALVDYILNIMKFIDAILSNNSTDDHCREFVIQDGLPHLLKILGLPNLPVDCPATNPAQAVATVCKSILNLAHEPQLFKEGLSQLSGVLTILKPLYSKLDVPGGSKLLLELASASNAESAFSTASTTPLLHAMGAAHGYVIMFVHVCRTGQSEIRNLSLQHWGVQEGITVLKGLSELYTSLVWESTLLLAYCSEDLMPSDCNFPREELEKLHSFFDRCDSTNTSDTTGNVASAMEALTTNPPPVTMDVDTDLTQMNKPSNHNIKYIKPLLGSSSRLGRALAELFGLLVKLSVGSPIRQRRGQNIVAAPPLPSPFARNVATALSMLLADGLDWEKLPPCPTPKCRLTFLICSVGFTSPMLFDEKRYPYHLMLKKFVERGGQTTFFKTFQWALSAGGTIPLDKGLEHPNLPEGTGGFLDAWLMLLEKMVNPKAILESPHTISSRSTNTTSPHDCTFDPVKYLIQIHKLAFESILLMWGKKPLPTYGTRMTESMLTIFKHILKGEKIIKDKLKTEETKTETPSSSAAPATTSSLLVTREADVNNDNLRQLMDMGFSREHALEALLHTISLEQATDYLLSNPPLARVNQSMDVDLEDDQVMQAIAISLGCSNSETAKKKEEVTDDSQPLSESLIEHFTQNCLQICLRLVKVIPECVHKVCELLVTITKRNGRVYRDNLLDSLVVEIYSNAVAVCVMCSGDISQADYTIMLESLYSHQLAQFTHLYILFFEVSSYFEMKIPCANAIFRKEEFLSVMIKLVSSIQAIMYKISTIPEPKWLATIILLVDEISKVSLCSERKELMHRSTSRTWRWFDLVSGKWTPYSTSNNKLINDAYWNGEQSIRVNCGRRRYTATFSNMLQMNDESGNNRPISMTLASLSHPSCTDLAKPALSEPTKTVLTEKEESKCVIFPNLDQAQKREMVRACVKFMHLPIDKDLLHSVMQICVRLTRSYELAKVFVEQGGIKCLLHMRHINEFGGYGILATILIKHALEEPNTLSYAIEKVIRGRTLTTIPPSYKELVYLIRQIGGAVTRCPETFLEVAKNILRVDIAAYRPDEVDIRLPVRADLPTRTKAPILEERSSNEVVCDLLDALLKPLEVITEGKPTSKSLSGTSTSTQSSETTTPEKAATASSSSQTESSETKTAEPTTVKIKPMLPKSIILKILADAVVSYGPVAKIVTDYIYPLDNSTVLSFVFDKILPEVTNISDSECSSMCRMLIAALASSNHSPEAQSTLVTEVKAALSRALLLPESTEKHTQIQHICGIISTMIENCPPSQARVKNQQPNGQMNNIVKLMIRKGLFNDLARVPHYLDLSSPNTSFTGNACLKPLEALSRIVNQPVPASVQAKKKNLHSTDDNTGFQSGTTSTEGTNAQGEETIEDTENTEQDVSAVASSLEAANVESTENDNVLEEIMEQLLDQGNTTDVSSNRNHSMDIDDHGNIFDHERDATEELMSTDSGDTDSNASDQAEDEDNEDNEVDDENIDETDENDDNNYDDEEGIGERRRASSHGDNDDDILMIHYTNAEHDFLPRVRWNENGFAIPIFDETNTNSEQSGSIIHPLLMSRNNAESSTSTITRTQRANRARRYQYLFNPRNPNPPVILQRLLGPHDSHITMGTNNILGGTQDMRESARVVVMDNFGLLPTHEEQIDFVDQSGYLFGPSLAATLNHVPPVLHWWNIESRCLDLESVYDTTTHICNELIPNLIKYRNIELLEKKKVKTDEEKTKHSRKQKLSIQSDETSQEPVPINFFDSPREPSSNDHTREPPLNIDTSPDPQLLLDFDEPSRDAPPSQQSRRRLYDPRNVEGLYGVSIDEDLTNTVNSDSQANTNSSEDTDIIRPSVDLTRNSGTDMTEPPSADTDDSEGASNMFEMPNLSSSIIRNRCDVVLAGPMGNLPIGNFSNPITENAEQEEDDSDRRERQSSDSIFFCRRRHNLRTLFEEALNQQIASLSNAYHNEENVTENTNQSTQTGEAADNNAASGDVVMSEPGPSTVPSDEVPDGVDPSFLAAIPPEMRREVLEQHRILNIQQRIATTRTALLEHTTSGPSTEVSPEFLAALPPALQEEVLTQQRLEQQRQAASRANPNEPVDAGAFFDTLQPSLRTMILSDMEDSQMSALPPDLAAEAQNLRRDLEARNRQMVQERFLQNNLTTIIRHSTRGRMSTRPSTFLPQRAHWSSWGRDLMSNSISQASNMKIRGRQLLDHEGLSCLLVLLFTDDPHLNKLRLHRVIRNLCFHGPTREWVVNALLSVIDRSVHTKPDESANKPSRKLPKPGPLSSKLMTDAKLLQSGGNWLNIRMEAALGCSANIFIVTKGPSKRSERSAIASISIHPQAAPIICKNALELLISLSKAFPASLLPLKALKDDDKNMISPVRVRSDNTSDFWEVLLKLDSASTKKGKSIAKSTTTLTSESDSVVSFEQSVFGQLLYMLSSPVINKNTQLTDNLLRLLSVITSSMPELSKPQSNSKSKTKIQKFESFPTPTQAINLAVNVITYKSCSEEGLEYITNLLLNLATASLEMSFLILNLLLSGAKRIGDIVREQIQKMLKDLMNMNSIQKRKIIDESSSSTSKGTIPNRFTKETVIITASTKVKTSCELQLPSMVPLTSKSSSQVFFLRVLRVIVNIRHSIKQSMKHGESTSLFQDLLALSDQLGNLDSLWDTLSQCLLELEHTPDHHAVLVLQPAVEAFFLVHSPQQGVTKMKETPATSEEDQSSQEPPATDANAASLPQAGNSGTEANSSQPGNEGELQTLESQTKAAVPPEQLRFLNFAEKHRTVLNQILRQSTAHLADGPFAVLVDHTRILDFDIKRRYFRTELERMDQGIRREETAVHVRRSHIFEDSFRELYRRTPEEWKNRFYIVFEEEEGQDAGGLLREWYVIISRDIFNPMYALFTVSPGDRVTYMINSASHYNPNHLCYYKFVGRVIAKAIYDNKLLECYFTRSFYKHILGIPVKYTDMESEDYSFYNSLVYIIENNISNLGLDLTFSTEINEFGVTETRDLIPNGRNVPVTEENKMEYIRLSCQMKMTGAIKQQLNAFLEGFYDIIPMRLISIFNEQELELLISGLPNVDIDDLKSNTEYHKYQANSLQIQWFWRALRAFDQADRAKFLQFVTGTSKVPLQGFAALEGMNGVQRFQIHRDDRSTDRLPSAHTCFNQLDLPVYETYDKLKSYLLKAIHECSEGFGFA